MAFEIDDELPPSKTPDIVAITGETRKDLIARIKIENLHVKEFEKPSADFEVIKKKATELLDDPEFKKIDLAYQPTLYRTQPEIDKATDAYLNKTMDLLKKQNIGFDNAVFISAILMRTSYAISIRDMDKNFLKDMPDGATVSPPITDSALEILRRMAEEKQKPTPAK